MTDYPSVKKRKSSWRQAQIQRKWKDLIVIFIVSVLLLVLFTGIKGTLSVKNQAQKSTWGGDESLGVVLKTDPVSVLIYQTDPQRINLYTVGSDIFYATGDALQPSKKVAELFNLEGPETASALTSLTGVNFSKYYFYKEPLNLSSKSVDEIFKDFASLKTPVKVIFGSFGSGTTNLTKVEILKLWWQVKGMEMKQIESSSMDSFTDEILSGSGEKFKGLDYEKTTSQLGKFFHGFAEKKRKVAIINASGEPGSLKLAGDLVSSYGWNVTSLSSEGEQQTGRIISSQKDGETQDLAKIFGCDINQAQNDQEQSVITIILGKDFAQKYF